VKPALERVDVCPICQGTTFKHKLTGSYFRGEPEDFKVEECQNCALWITNPRPKADAIARYYDSEDYVSHTDGSGGLLDRIYGLVRRIATQAKLKMLERYSQKGELVDFGAGTGYFAMQAQKNGWKATGVEPSQVAREVAANRGLILESEEYLDQLPDHSLQAITLWHVLEHLEDPRESLQKFKTKLAGGGCLFIAVPNHESFDARVYGGNWAALDLPLHFYHFKKSNIKDLANRLDLELLSIRNMPFDAFYVALLSEKNKGGSILRALRIAMISNGKGWIGKNQSSLIYVLRKN